MKRIIGIILIVLLLMGMSVFAGCSHKAEAQEILWAITVEKEGGRSVEFTNVDASSIDMVAIEAVKEKKDGSKINENWEGMPVSEVLKAAGFNDYNTVAVEASDGYSKEFDKATIDDSGTIFGLKLDGEDIDEEDGPIQLVVSSMSGSSWIKNVARVVIIE